MCKEYKRYDGETNEQLLLRVGDDKEAQNMTWAEICEIMNTLTGNHYNESTWRKQYQIFKKMFDSNKDQYFDGDYLEELERKERELYKQKVKTSDVLREYRSTLRDEARIETIIDAIKEDNARVDLSSFFENEYEKEINPEYHNKAVLAIGDWHIGDSFENFYNSYNFQVAVHRIKELRRKVLHFCEQNKVNKLHIVNLGDMINGNIHVTTRIQNELDAVQQVKMAARLIYGLLVGLQREGLKITYRSVLDNHSRITANKKEHIEKESFASLIDWWLQTKLQEYNVHTENKIEFALDNIDENIGYLAVGDKKIAFTHGHLGKPSTIVQDLSLSTGIMFDMFIVGHWHEDKVKNFQGKKVYYNGSLKGVDDYALSLRKFSAPSQTLLIFDNDDTINIPIQL